MKKRLVCLSNSKKLGGRCLAGIELDNQNNPVIVNRRPNWIRPICHTENGVVPTKLVSHINILDVIEIDVTGKPNTDYQSENAFFVENSLRIVWKFKKDNLNSLCENPPTIFNGSSSAVHKSQIENLHSSLILINTHDFKITEATNTESKSQKRLLFIHGKYQYSLPITDPVFLRNYQSNPNCLYGISELFLCLSLGVLFHGSYYKLVAGIITRENHNRSKNFSDIVDTEVAFNKYPSGIKPKLVSTTQEQIILSSPKDISAHKSGMIESNEHYALTVAEAAMKQLGVSVAGNIKRFAKPGWFFAGETIACCPKCNRKLAGFRMPYTTSAGKTYHYWALVCPLCARAYEPNQLGKDASAALYKSSSFRPTKKAE